MLLELYVTAAAILSGGTCATIDNYENKAVWKEPNAPVVATTYSDMGGVGLIYDTYPETTDGILALLHAEDDLTIGPAGHKTPLRCVTRNHHATPIVSGDYNPHDHN